MRHDRSATDLLDRHFAAFVDAETQGLLRTATLITGAAHLGEDLLQDTFASLYPRWSKVMAADSAVAYVRRSLVNRNLSHARRPTTQTTTLDAALLRSAATSEATATVDDRDELRQLLRELTSRQRTALVLRYFHDLNDSQIAELMGCRVGTVRSLISRGLTSLRSNSSMPTAAGATAETT